MKIARLAALTLAVPALACAGAQEESRSVPPAEASAPAAPARAAATLDPASVIRAAQSSRECEQSAAEQRTASAQRGWEMLRGCLERFRFPRDTFLSLSLLVPAWREELKTRKEAPQLLARLIAQRGGDVEGDLARLAEGDLRLPTFAETAESGVVGRLVLVRGMLFPNDDPSAPLTLKETIVRAVDDSATRWRSRPGTTINRSFFTGRAALARLARTDMAVTVEKEYVLLVRADRIRGPALRRVLQITVLAAFAPAALMVD